MYKVLFFQKYHFFLIPQALIDKYIISSASIAEIQDYKLIISLSKKGAYLDASR